MKSLTSNPGAVLTRVALFFCTALLLSATVGCGVPASHPTDWETRQDYLESKVDRIRLQMDRSRSQSEKTDFWRFTSALLALLVLSALVGGAALGSRARQNSLGYGEPLESEEALTDPQDEVVC
ncbi:MAG: hypothetical protein AAF491_00155 [Verrucomicrobiota bacterium]